MFDHVLSILVIVRRYTLIFSLCRKVRPSNAQCLFSYNPEASLDADLRVQLSADQVGEISRPVHRAASQSWSAIIKLALIVSKRMDLGLNTLVTITSQDIVVLKYDC